MAFTTVLAALLSAGESPAILVLRLLGAVTLVWLAALGMTALLSRRSSESLRHHIWSLSTVAALVLPALIYSLPEWRVAHFRVSAVAQPLVQLAPEPVHEAPVAIRPASHQASRRKNEKRTKRKPSRLRPARHSTSLRARSRGRR